MSSDLRNWTAFGTGLGIEVRAEDLWATVVRLRPGGVTVLGSARVEKYRERPAAEWGAELQRFLKELGCGHLAVTVVLPRQSVIVRQIALPGVGDKDLAAAVQYQVDALHPFAEEDAVYTFDRLGGSAAVLVAVIRRQTMEEFVTLFAEAGLKLASLTYSAAAVYSALRILAQPPKGGFIGVHPGEGEYELYGESPAKPLFSATFEMPADRAAALAAAELRLPDAEAQPLSKLLPRPVAYPESHDPDRPDFAWHTMPYAAAIANACPWLALNGNLLPAEMRQQTSRARWIPTIALATALGGLLIALVLQPGYEDRQYLKMLEREIARIEPAAKQIEAMDKQVSVLRLRSMVLDEIRRRPQQDMDTLNELTRLLAPPTFLGRLDLTRSQVQLGGEAEQAAALLRELDNSPWFKESEFTLPYARVGNMEVFQIRSQREAPKEGAPGAQMAGVPAQPVATQPPAGVPAAGPNVNQPVAVPPSPSVYQPVAPR